MWVLVFTDSKFSLNVTPANSEGNLYMMHNSWRTLVYQEVRLLIGPLSKLIVTM